MDIYYIREDGSRYSLSGGGAGTILGDMNLFVPYGDSLYAEATDNVVCVALDTNKHYDALMKSTEFLQLIASSLSNKMNTITTIDAKPSTLEERVETYMVYKCSDMCIRGLEQAAFRLNCSPRQLQRIMNKLVNDKIVEKIGKGSYRLLRKPQF